MNDTTYLARHKTDVAGASPVSTPIFQTGAFRSGDPYFYTRKDNPNFEEVEAIFKKLDVANSATLVSSGMAAVAAVISFLKPGSSLVVNRLIYGCSHRLLSDYGTHYGVDVRFVDLSDLNAAQEALTSAVDMVFFETPTNPFLKTVDIATVSTLLHQANPAGIVVVDNTWATPLYQKPLTLGADVCVYSGSKFFCGHSDIIIGVVTTSHSEMAAHVEKQRFYCGAVPGPFDAWLLRRSMQTLALRMEQHRKSTAAVADFLQNSPHVKQIFLPETDAKQLRAYGGLIFAQLNVADYAAVRRFMDALTLFDQGTAMASVTSAVACPYHGSHLSMTPEEKARIGLDERLVRFSIGIEDVEDLIADIQQAFDVCGRVE